MLDRRWVRELTVEVLLLAGLLTTLEADAPSAARGIGAAIAITSLRRLIRQELHHG